MATNSYTKAAATVAVVTILTACGGGGSSSFAGPTDAQGFWVGTTNDGRTVWMLLQDDGVYWALYSPVGNPDLIAGLFQGRAHASSGNLSSSDARDFNIELQEITDGSLSGNYALQLSLDGTVTAFVGGSVTFNLDYDASYDLIPSLVTVAATYTGEALTIDGEDTATLAISAAGALSGTSALGCSYHGTVTPDTAGNFYDISVTFEGGNCSNGTSTVSGVAVLDESTGTIYAAALNGSRTNGFLFIGS